MRFSCCCNQDGRKTTSLKKEISLLRFHGVVIIIFRRCEHGVKNAKGENEKHFHIFFALVSFFFGEVHLEN